MKGEISGILNLSLSLGSAASMGSFRRVLSSLVAERIAITRELLGPAADECRDFVLSLILSLSLIHL